MQAIGEIYGSRTPAVELIFDSLFMRRGDTISFCGKTPAHAAIGLVAGLICWLLVTAPAWSAPTTSQMLAVELIRAAQGPAAAQPLTTTSLEAALLLANEAVALDPDNAELWQVALQIALLAEDEPTKRRAADRLLKLDPEDERVRLMRLNVALERHQTAEDRTEAYQTLLADNNIARIGAAVASRLALDLALLYQRQGETERFSQWLSKAISWDSSNRAAAAIATGFFRMNVADPVAEAELLINLMIADPTDVTTQVALAQSLLEQGAFAGAIRFYGLVVRSQEADGRSPANHLISDYAMAVWGNGDAGAALDVLKRRQAMMEVSYKQLFAREQPDLPPDQADKIINTLNRDLLAVMAVIHHSLEDEAAAASRDQVLDAYATAIEQAREDLREAQESARSVDSFNNTLANLHLERAWLGLWLGADAAAMMEDVEQADGVQPISDMARSRFAGWKALREGDHEAALEQLRPLADQDTSARIGVALALEQQGRNRDAAREFLIAVQSQPGSLIGLWTAQRLERMLGQRMPKSEEATRLERLVATVSVQFDRTVDDPSRAISLRLIPRKVTFAPHEPLRVDIEITNLSGYPLAIDRNGPIRSQLLILPSIRSADVASLGNLRPFVIDIGRRLRLAPHQKLTIPLDLRHYQPGDALNNLVVGGGIVRVKTILNFNMTPQGLPVPGLYGQEVEAPLLRVDGFRIGDTWLRESTASMAQAGPDSPVELLTRMAVLGHVIAPRLSFDVEPEQQQLISDARQALAEGFARLDPIAQAFVMATLPQGEGNAIEGIQPILTIAQKSTDRLVQLAYLLFFSSGATDPMIDAALRGDDPVLRRLAELIKINAAEAEESGAPQP